MPKIPLANTKLHATVDVQDFRRVRELLWYVVTSSRNGQKRARNGEVGYMHRFILNIDDPRLQVRHLNGNGLDNRRRNLAVLDHRQAQGLRKKSKSKRHTSRYKGVSKETETGLWRAQLAGKTIGRFRTQVAAARAYDTYAKQLFGPLAEVNFK